MTKVEEKIKIAKQIANEVVDAILPQILAGIITENTLKTTIDFTIREMLDRYVVVDKNELKNKLEVVKYDYGQKELKIPGVQYITGLRVVQTLPLETVEIFGDDFIKKEIKDMFISALENLEDLKDD